MAQFENSPQTFRPLYHKLRSSGSNKHGNDVEYASPPRKPSLRQNSIAPYFIENLTNTVCFENQPLRFGARFVADPHPTVTWLKNNQNLAESSRIRQCIDKSGHVWLDFESVETNDAGLYKVILQNPYGQMESTAQVLIYGFQPESLVKRKSFSMGNPPKLITPLKDVEAAEGETIILNCIIQSSSLPKVIWMKNRLPLPLSSRIESNFDLRGNVQLRILGADNKDSGTYTVKCENAFGFVETSCQLMINSERRVLRQETKDSSHLPRFIKPPESQMAKEGDFVVLNCDIESMGKTKVAWLHNNKTLMASSRLNSFFDGHTATLQIANFSDFDVGTYTVVAENNYGANKYTVSVHLMTPQTKFQPQQLSMTRIPKIRESLQQDISLQKKTLPKAEIDTEPVIDPQAFVHLEKKLNKETPTEGGIDESSVVNLKEIELLEKRRANKLAALKNKVVEGPQIDESSFVDMKSIQALENRAKILREKEKKETESGIDSSPIVDPSAFKYIEKTESKKAVDTSPSIDSTSMVDPSSFKYLEIPEPKKVYSGPSVDTTPMINPAAFRYIEPIMRPKPQKVESSIDTSPIIDSRSFMHLEKHPKKSDKPEESMIDYTPMIPPDAFKYLERQQDQRSKPDLSPAIDTRSYVDQNAFRFLELPQYVKPEVTAGIDETSYVSRNAFRYIEAPEPLKHEEVGPAIDSRPIISPQAFTALEAKPTPTKPDIGPAIDDRPLIDPAAFAALDTEHKKTTPVTEKEPETAPILISKISDVYVAEGQSAIFTAQLYGKPQPTVIWLKDGRTLITSSRISSSYDILSKAAILTITSVRVEDSGTYELLASNPAGEQKCTARLFIKSSPSIDETNFIPLNQFRDVELKDLHTSKALSAGVDREPIANMEAIEALETSRQKAYEEEIKEHGIRPEVLQQLQDLNVKEGTTAYLKAKFSGHPIPELTWVKDLQSLQFSNRVTMEYDINTSTATLKINGTTASDSGIYMVVAANAFGAVSSRCKLQVETEPNISEQSFVRSDAINILDEKTKTLKHDKNFELDISKEIKTSKPVHFIASTDNKASKPASIVSELKDACVKEGEKFRFMAGVDGIPEPTCTWFHNSKQLIASSRISFTYDAFNKLACLDFNGVRAEDVGTYTLNVRNDLQSAESTAKLAVTIQPKVDPTPMKSEKIFAMLELEPIKEDNIIPGVDETSFISSSFAADSKQSNEALFAPFFETMPNDVRTKERKDVTFTAKVRGNPFPKAYWYKDGKACEASSRTNAVTSLSESTLSLTISSVNKYDEGTYELVIVNTKGESRSACKLYIDADAIIDESSYIEPNAFKALEKTAVKPEIQSGVDETSFVNAEQFKYLEKSPTVDTTYKEDRSNYRMPTVFSPLMPSYSGKETDNMVLVCGVDAYPPPKVTWFKDGQPLIASNRISYDYDLSAKQCLLRIHSLERVDKGTYTLNVENELGRLTSATKVEVMDVSNVDTESFVPIEAFTSLEKTVQKTMDIIPSVDTTAIINPDAFKLLEQPIRKVEEAEEDVFEEVKPQITEEMKSIKAEEGEEVTLSVGLIGYPMCEIIWLRNDAILDASSRYDLHYDLLSKTAYFHIASVRAEDTGTYTITAKNKLGICSSKGQLVVAPSKRIEESAYVSLNNIQELEKTFPQPDTTVPGVDSSYYIEPSVFAELELKKPTAQAFEPEIKNKPPQIISELKDVSVDEGESASLLAMVTGIPLPKFIWKRNGKNIEASSNVFSIYNHHSNEIQLKVIFALQENSGYYELIAENPLGTASTSCNLVVKESKPIDERPMKPLEAFTGLERTYEKTYSGGIDIAPITKEPDQFRMLEVKHMVPVAFEEDKSKYRAPQIIKGLSNCECDENDSITLSVTLDGIPLPTFIWLKDDLQIEASSRFSSHYDIHTKQLILIIKNAGIRDAGTYRLVALNVMGKAETTATIVVKPVSGIVTDFFVAPENFTVLDTYTEKKDIVIPGVDETSKISDVSKLLSLEQKPEKTDDVIPGVDMTSFSKNLDYLESIENKPIVKQPFEVDKTNYRAPKIITPFKDQMIANESEDVSLFATVDSYPIPTLTWTKNGIPVDASSRLLLNYNPADNILFLKICKTVQGDSGIHLITVQNEVGNCTLTTNLKILPTSSIDTTHYIDESAISKIEQKGVSKEDIKPGVDTTGFVDIEVFAPLEKKPQQTDVTPGIDTTGFIDYSLISKLEAEPPKAENESKDFMGTAPILLSMIKDTETNEGVDAYMIATVDGYPLPKITWLKGKQQIISSSRVITNYDLLSKASYLLIQKTQLNDNDVYTMIAENDYGVCQCSAHLTVVPTPGIDKQSYIGLSAFENLEPKYEKVVEDVRPEVDSSAFVDPTKFIALESKEMPYEQEPEIKGSPPSLLEPLKDANVNDNEVVIFSAKISGTPVPSFTWKKDNHEIIASSNMVTTYEPHSKLAILKILNVNKELHEGSYSVTASNMHGTVQSTANLSISESRKIDDRALIPPEKFEKLEVEIKRSESVAGIDETPLSHDPQKFLKLDTPKVYEAQEIVENLIAPYFIEPLKPPVLEAKEYENITLSAKADGIPQPSFMWMKDGSNLVSSCRFGTHYDKKTKTITLYIRSLSHLDEGLYYVIAKNAAGFVNSSFSTVKVTADIRVDESSNADMNVIKALEMKPETPDNIVPGIDQTSMHDLSKFKSLEQPLIQHKYEGPDIDTKSYIDIKNIEELETAGLKYTKHDEEEEVIKAPVIISPLTSATVSELETAILYVGVYGYPTPKFYLLHDNKPLQESSRITIEYDLNLKVLTIKIADTKLTDAGKYTLKLSNEAGSVETEATLTVNKDKSIITDSTFDMNAVSSLEKEIPKPEYKAGVDEKYFIDPNVFSSLELIKPKENVIPGIDATPMISPEAFRKLEAKVAPGELVADSINVMIPAISKSLDSIKTKQGKNIVTTCIVQGYPRPEFTWYKDGVLLPASSRYSSHYDMNTKQLWLYIMSVTLSDEGIYTLKAENCGGSCESSCEIIVEKTEAIDSTSQFDENTFKDLEKKPQISLEPVEIRSVAPSFFDQNSTTLSMSEGNNLNLTLFVYGYPMPTFEIFHNHLPLPKSDRYQIEYNQNKKCLFIQIRFLRTADAGHYLCIASNGAGTAEHTFTLNVDAVPSIDTSSGVKNLENFEQLERRLPVTVYAAGVETSSYVDDLEKFKLLEVKSEIKKPADNFIKKLISPVIIASLENVQTAELENVILRAKINAAYPYPKITWYFNGAEIKYSNRYISSYNMMEGTITLTILACSISDSGRYRIVISNEGGTVESSCALTVLQTPGIDDTTKRPLDKYQNLESTRTAVAKETIEFHGTTDEQLKAINELEKSISNKEKQIIDIPIPNIPIQVITPIEDVNCKEGDCSCFRATLHGKPIPKFVWYKDGEEIRSSNRYTSYYDLYSQMIILRIDNVLITDSGEYRLEASNVCGVVTLTAKMAVTKVPSIEEQPITSSIAKIEKLELKPVKEDGVVAGISNESHVPMSRFEHFEFKPSPQTEIIAGVDTSGFVPPERFEALDKKHAEEKLVSAGIDSNPFISEETLSRLKKMEVETIEPQKPIDEIIPTLVLLQDMVDVDIIENSTARISCRINSYPLPQISWYKNGYLLSLSERIYSEFNPYHGIVCLTIKNALKADEGKYEAFIENAAGILKPSASLNVYQTPSIDDTSFLSKDAFFYKDEMINLPCGNPGFLILPKDNVAFVRSTARFSYVPAGNPFPDIQWFKNGASLKEDIRHTSSVNEQGVYSLMIRNITSEDAGEYVCLLKNENGSATVSVKLDVRNYQEKPSFVRELCDISAKEGDSFRLFVEVSGDDTREFTWTKDDTPIGNFYRIETSGKVSTLFIDNASVKDSGWYSCTAINESGTSTTRCKLIVLTQEFEAEQVKFGPSMLRNPFLGTERKKFKLLPPEVGPPEPTEVYRLKPRRSQIKGSQEKSEIDESLSYMLPPKFTTNLPESITVDEGQICDLQLSYIPVSDETLKISCYKDGTLVKYGDRFDQTYEKGLARFLIKWVIPEDTGSYEFVAENRTGSSSVKFNLVCKSQRPISYETRMQPKGVKQLQALEEKLNVDKKEEFYDASEKKESIKTATIPQFFVELLDAEATEGEPIKFSVKVGGNPKPRVIWYVNNKPATSGGRYIENYDGMMHFLLINKTRQFDQGTVKCLARNKAGQAETTCKLTVKKNVLSPLSYLLLKAGVELQMDTNEFFLAEKELNDRLRQKSMSKSLHEEAEKEVQNFIQELYEKHKFLSSQRKKVELPFMPAVQSTPPRFTTPLCNKNGTEGESVSLEVHFEPKNSSVVWFKGISQLQSSEDFKIITKEDGSSSLNIRKLYSNDMGQYSAKITSHLGSSISTAEIYPARGTSGTASVSKCPPIFISPIQNTTIPQKQPVMFGFEIKSDGRPLKVTWFRNNQPIDSTEEFQTIFDGSKGMLYIKETYLEDSGTYTCRAENESGIVESSAKLNVQKYH